MWKKKKAVALEVEPRSVGESTGDPSDKALDVVTTLVRLFGKHAFDTDAADALSVAARCDEWATRISLGAPRPHPSGSPLPSEPRPSESGAYSARRDWPGLIGFIRDQRRAESEYVVRRLGDFREAILCFAGYLNKAVGEERQSDVAVEKHLRTLSQALETRDVTRICAEAEFVVDAVRQSMTERRRREVEQVSALGERVQGLREELSEARKKAELDALTQLSNRAALDAHLTSLAAFGVLLGEAPWLMLVDLDHFKSINDNYGHPAGDEVLRQVSRCLSRTFLRKQDFVCRYGGEEFAAVLLETTEAQMVVLTDRLMATVRGLRVLHGADEISVRLSVGLAALCPGESVASWLGRADAALYRAKKEGRDTYRLAAMALSNAATASP